MVWKYHIPSCDMPLKILEKKRGIQTQVKLRTKQIVLKNYAKNEDHSL